MIKRTVSREARLARAGFRATKRKVVLARGDSDIHISDVPQSGWKRFRIEWDEQVVLVVEARTVVVIAIRRDQCCIRLYDVQDLGEDAILGIRCWQVVEDAEAA